MPAAALNWMELNLTNRCAWIALLSGLLATADAGAARYFCTGGELAPYTASYEVRRNDKRFGSAEVTLTREDDAATWTYTMETKAAKGLAGLLGGQVLERTWFEYVDGKPRPLRYRYERGTSFSKRSTFAEFDWRRRRASGNYKKNEWALPLAEHQTDRMLVNLLLIQALAREAPRLSFDTVEKGSVDTLSFVRDGQIEIETGSGTYRTVAVEREHRNRNRETQSWHAPELAFLPVRLRQIDGDDDETIELILESVEFEPCRRGSPAALAGDRR